MSNRSAIGLIVLLSLSFYGCGFQMQGAFSVPERMERTYIASEDQYSLFYRELRRSLQANGMQLAASPAEATAVLSIHTDKTDQRVLSVSARNVPTEYEVYYSIEYSVDSGEENLMKRQFINLTRDYTYDETLVLGKAKEEALLREAIVDDLVRIVLKQLGTM
ncbi:MAG: LPS assembly lipoprotein LptE [Woeseiaceae bacterium]